MTYTFRILGSIVFCLALGLPTVDAGLLGEAIDCPPDLAPYEIGGKWGVRSVDGEVVLEPVFHFINSYCEGLAAFSTKVGSDLKYGYLDRMGQVAILPQFDQAGCFHEGLAGVCLEAERPLSAEPQRVAGCRWGFVDLNGELVVDTTFDALGSFSEGLAAVQIGHSWGYIDRSGILVIRPAYQSADLFFEGLAAVRLEGKVGYISHSGKFVLTPQFEQGGRFSEGIAPVEVSGQWIYVNIEGETIIGPIPDALAVSSFREGLAEVQTSKSFFTIDRTGLAVQIQTVPRDPKSTK